MTAQSSHARLFTGASAGRARRTARPGNDADAAAAPLPGTDARATDDDLAAIRRLRDEERASAPPPPSTARCCPAVGEGNEGGHRGRGPPTADLLERADVEARYAEARAPAASAAGPPRFAPPRRAERVHGKQLAGRAENAPRTTRRGRPVVTGELGATHVWFEHEDTFAKRMAAIAREARRT